MLPIRMDVIIYWRCNAFFIILQKIATANRCKNIKYEGTHVS